jgi:hypothetical protein
MMPLTIDFMVSPGIASTAHDRGAAHPSRPRKHWPGYWPAGVRTPGPRRATTWRCAHRWCLATAAGRALRVPTTSRRPFLYSRKGLLGAEVRSWRLHSNRSCAWPASVRRTPGVMVGAGRGWWQAVIPEPNGEQVITRHTRPAARLARRADRRARTVAMPKPGR